MGSMGAGELILPLAIFVIPVILFWRIFKKAGYPPAMGLLMLMPIVNLIAVAILAYSEWPIEQELRQARQKQSTIES